MTRGPVNCNNQGWILGCNQGVVRTGLVAQPHHMLEDMLGTTLCSSAGGNIEHEVLIVAQASLFGKDIA